uniref:Protein TsetseEP domain-containing protein n=1 Tax=Anopheles quadriannulatus TaxID=34691 RepID=A0A182XLN2_ANOQN
MYALAVSVALACIVLQVAYSRPDFGIRGTIDGVSNVNARAILVKEYFLRVNDYIIPDQKSDIATLRDAAKTLQAIGQSVNSLGPALMDALTTATDNDSGDVNATFALINMARLNFEGYVEINLNEQILNLNTLLGMHVRDQLVDDFYHISNRLAAVNNTLGQLQSAVVAANNAASGGPVSQDLIRQFVSADLVAQLSRHLTLLAYRIPVLTYTVTSSLENIEQADAYYYGLVQDSDRVLNEIETSGDEFNMLAGNYSLLVEQQMNQLIADYKPELSLANDSATALNVTTLATVVTDLKNVTDAKLAETLKAYKDLYLPAILALSRLLPIESNFSFLTGENPAAVLVGVLIANGPFSRFCFWKYSSLLHNILLTSNFAAECYDREYNRLSTLQQALLLQIELISYSLEIVNPYSVVCGFLPPSAALRTEQCANEIASYFNIISNDFSSKLGAFVNLTSIELNASKQRLSVCWSAKIQSTFVKYQTLIPEIRNCSVTGPEL